MNADEAANATIIAKGYGEARRSPAIASAIGAISTAVAVFEMNRPSAAVTTNSIAMTTRGPASPTKATSPSAARSTPPVRCSATENGIIPTIRIRLFQLIDR